MKAVYLGGEGIYRERTEGDGSIEVIHVKGRCTADDMRNIEVLGERMLLAFDDAVWMSLDSGRY